MQSRRAVLAGLAMLAFAGSAFGGMIYTVAGSGDQLATINSSTGVGSLIGPFGAGYSNLKGLAFSPSGTLYTDVSGQLATVNVTTGAATPFGTTNSDVMLAFGPDGTLYGTSLNGAYLQVVNVTTGAGTNRPQPLNFPGIMDLAFSPQGVLYAVSSSTAGSTSAIYQVDASTGAGTLVATLNVASLMGLTFDAAGNLYATDYVSSSKLYSINLGAQSVTTIGTTGLSNSHGLDMNNFTSPVPEPAAWMFMGSGLLAFFGVRRAFRR